ncbi:hypothetical protein EXIGLDRAFT_278873 [Exidia glandulosa HHB12029]|uniref:Uncharacterized protein n=1 Tax=Exidia glandulosa HHB12029 TaxID=1314781 RepID=A0A165DJW7_EXIGL|nr:hypothetical protein EXIGLDRAFT_278873 [Exidia glandulosa HHB12029]
MSLVPTTPYDQGVTVTYATIALLCQTFFFGVYATLMPFSIYLVIKRGRSSGRPWLFWVTVFMFLLSAAYWAASAAHLFLCLRAFFTDPSPALALRVDVFSTLAHAVVLINCVLTDAVIVWRAWILCSDDSRRILYLPCVFLFLTSLSVASTIAARIIIIAYRMTHDGERSPRLLFAINTSQVSSLGFTLITNISATGIIAAKAWRYRRMMKQSIRDAERHGTKLETIFALIIESGATYCFSGITVLISSVLRLKHGTLGDVYAPVNVQIAGIYPTIVLLVISMHLTMKETTFFSGGPDSQSHNLQFAAHPAAGHNPSGTTLNSNSRCANIDPITRPMRNRSVVSNCDRAPRLQTLSVGDDFLAEDLVAGNYYCTRTLLSEESP